MSHRKCHTHPSFLHLHCLQLQPVHLPYYPTRCHLWFLIWLEILHFLNEQETISPDSSFRLTINSTTININIDLIVVFKSHNFTCFIFDSMILYFDLAKWSCNCLDFIVNFHISKHLCYYIRVISLNCLVPCF